MSVRFAPPVRAVAVTCTLVSLAACAAERRAPTAPPSFSASSAGARRPTRAPVTSGARYSDRGAKPATGRSGSAALTAEAVFGADGLTTLTVTPYRASDAQYLTPVGCIEKVMVKAYRTDGSLAWVRNFTGLGLADGAAFTVPLAGLLPGATLVVQANVKCIDGRRTDVVTVRPVVVRRTDPAVTALAAPAQAARNTPILVVATVRELGGGQGAAGTCYLTVDGALADSVHIWVDAGGTVDCLFAPAFATLGTHALRVDLLHVVPADADPTNNTRSASVAVVAPPPPPPLPAFLITAIVYDDSVDEADLFLYSQRLVSAPSVLLDTMYTLFSRRGNDQFAGFHGIIYQAVPFPLERFVASQWSGAARFDTVSLADVAATPGSAVGATCADMSAGALFRLVCSYAPDALFPYGRTSVIYERTVSNAAYVSQQYFVHFEGGVPTACDPASTDPGADCYYLTAPLGAPLTPYADSYAFTVLLETPTHRYSSHVSIPLESAPLPIAVPYACSDVTFTGGDGREILYHSCQSVTGTMVRKTGRMPYLVGLTEALAP